MLNRPLKMWNLMNDELFFLSLRGWSVLFVLSGWYIYGTIMAWIMVSAVVHLIYCFSNCGCCALQLRPGKLRLVTSCTMYPQILYHLTLCESRRVLINYFWDSLVDNSCRATVSTLNGRLSTWVGAVLCTCRPCTWLGHVDKRTCLPLFEQLEYGDRSV